MTTTTTTAAPPIGARVTIREGLYAGHTATIVPASRSPYAETFPELIAVETADGVHLTRPGNVEVVTR